MDQPSHNTTSLENDWLRNVFIQHYSLQPTAITRIERGITNICFEVTTSQNDYFVKIIRNADHRAIEEELVFTDYLSKHHVALIRPKESNVGRLLYEYDHGAVIVYPFIRGYFDGLTKTINIAYIRSIAKAVAQIHNIKLSGNLPRKRHRVLKRNVIEELFADTREKSETQNFLQRHYIPLRKRIDQLHVPVCINHGDIWPGNFFLTKHFRVKYVLDFEDVEIYHRLNDVAITIQGFCYTANKLSMNKLKQFMEEYTKSIKLESVELEHFFDYMRFSLLWIIGWRYYDFHIRGKNEKERDSYTTAIRRYREMVTMEHAIQRLALSYE